MANDPRGAELVRATVFSVAFLVGGWLTSCVPPARRLPPELPEVSGLVYAQGGRLLAINDGGNPAVVYALGPGAHGVERFGTAGHNRDWEAMSSDGRGRIIVCDVGDNARVRDSIRVLAYDTSGRLTGDYGLAYPNGAHDCEACLLRGDTLTLITKARTLGGGRFRTAHVFRARIGTDRRLTLVDSFVLRRRSVTDAVHLEGDTLAVLAYDFRFLGPLPLSKTTVYVGTLSGFRQNRQRRRKIHAPFTLTQFEAMAYPGDGDGVLLASERTWILPQRWRRISLP